MTYINNLFDILYNLILIIILVYIIWNFIIKEIRKNKVDNNQTHNYVKLYFDKLFIIKLIRIVKENLILSSSTHAITNELMGYFGLNSATLYKNVHLANNKIAPHFIAVNANSINIKNDLNKYIGTCYEKLYERSVITIKSLEEGEEVECMVFPLKRTKTILGALTVTKACKGKFESSDFDTILAICGILELALTSEVNLFNNSSH
jgi:hypothetical protein